MTSPQRAVTDQLIAWIQADVEDADGWTFVRAIPRDYSTGGQHCAVWWLGDEPFSDDSTTGYLGLADAYLIRYWEPAPETSRVSEDEEAEQRIEETVQQVRACILGHRGLNASNLNNAFELAYLGSRKLASEDAASSVRGFEITVRVRRPEMFG